MKALNEYINFKIKQYVRISGFDTKQTNAKDALKSAVAPMLKGWVAEAIKSGC